MRRSPFGFFAGVLVGIFAAIVALPVLLVDTSVSPSIAAPDDGTDAPTPGGPSASPTLSASETPTGPTDRPAAGPAQGPTSVPTAGVDGTSRPRAAGGVVAEGPGVTDSSIRIGFLLFGAATASGMGFADTGLDPNQQRAAFQAYVDEINDAGGVNGRRLEAVYSTFDILSPSTERQSCLELTEDQEVFALVGNLFSQSAYLCVTAEHDRVLISLGATATPETYQRSNGFLFSNYMEGDRMMRSLAAELRRLGHIGDYTFGVVSDDGYDTNAATSGTLIREIQRLGGTVGHHAHLAADFSVGSSQVPLEVQRMKGAQVDAIILLANPIYATQFVREADGNLYRPQYFTSDYAALATDVGQANMPDSYSGAINFSTIRQGDTRANLPEPARDRHCREVYEQRTGQALQRDSTPWGVALQYCNLVRFLELGLRAAGSNVTSEGLSAGIQSLGQVAVAQSGGGSFAAGKFGFNDLVRTHVWRSDCKCMIPIDDFHRPGQAP